MNLWVDGTVSKVDIIACISYCNTLTSSAICLLYSFITAWSSTFKIGKNLSMKSSVLNDTNISHGLIPRTYTSKDLRKLLMQKLIKTLPCTFLLYEENCCKRQVPWQICIYSARQNSVFSLLHYLCTEYKIGV